MVLNETSVDFKFQQKTAVPSCLEHVPMFG